MINLTKRSLTWGMIEILLRKSLSPNFKISTPSIKICPEGSLSRNRVVKSDDFPAPVLPQTPICEERNASIIKLV